MADLAALDELCAWMRLNGATSARVGEVALTLGSPIASPVTLEDVQSVTPADAARRDLELLLHSSGSDASMFLDRQGRTA